MSCKSCKSNSCSCHLKCKRRCPKIRRCNPFAKFTCPWNFCATTNVLTCCRR